MADHIINESCRERFKRNEDDVKGLNDRVNKGVDRLSKVEESSKSAHHRIKDTNTIIEKLEERLEEVEEQSTAVVLLAKSVEHMATQNEKILIEMKAQRDDITILQNKPAQEALGYWKMFVGGLVIALSGALAGVIGTILLSKG